MSREILFKAKRTDNGEWVNGCLLIDYITGQYFIHQYGDSVNESTKIGEEGFLRFLAFEIDPSTLCRYTGLTDKNGKKVWENDIVKFEDTGEEGYEYKEGFDYINRAKVIWNKGRFESSCYLCNNSGTLDLMNNSPEEFYDMFEEYAEVIGNVFDNPELLEQEENAE